MNSIIKSRVQAVTSADPSPDVKPVDLTPIGPQVDDDLGSGLDLSRVKDPVLRAQILARGIVRDAQEEAEGIRREAYDEGRRAGAEQAASDANELIARLESDIRQIASDRAEVFDAIEPQMLKLCLEIVEKVIRHEIRTDQRVVMRAIKSCLRRIKDSDQICIHVSPEEVEAVRARRDELAAMADGAGEIRIVDDRRVDPGGCLVESCAGDYDARVASQLNRIDEKLRETLTNDRDHLPETQSGEVLPGDQPA